MTRPAPMAACIALLRVFDADNPTPQQTIATASGAVQQAVGDTVAVDLNDGQFAALVDFYIWQGADAFADSDIVAWVMGGNYAKPGRELPKLGPRGVAERDIWNLGNTA